MLCAAAAAAAAISIQIPEGAELEVRLISPVSTLSSRTGDKVEAVLIAPFVQSSQVALEPGAVLRGRIESIEKAKGEDRAHLEIHFTNLTVPNGKDHRIDGRVALVDNARENVDTKGRVFGILKSETLSAQLDRALDGLHGVAADLALLLQGAKAFLIKEADPEISYEKGTELFVKLLKPVSLDQAPVPLPPLPARDPELVGIVKNKPVRTMAERPRVLSDITNLMFIGSRADIENAFKAAGWTPAASLNANSVWETIRSVIEARGYREAPVSVLLLDGRRPDLVFQKMNNTFAMRHHLRIWKTDDLYKGREVWMGAATHDNGIAFAADERTFFHTIHPEIDKERTKIANDLAFAGFAREIARVDRPDAPRDTKNATGDRMVTDGRLVVLSISPHEHSNSRERQADH